MLLKAKKKNLNPNALKIFYLELILLNTYNFELDKESEIINKDKAKIFYMI